MQHDFHFISKKDPKIKKAYNDILNILKEVQDLVRKKFTFRFDVVGSYKRNMITYDAKSNVGYDFDFNIEVNDGNDRYKPKQLKNMLQNAIDAVCVKYGYDHPEDSTRVLTIKMKNRKKSCILHSCDFAIVNNYIDDDGYEGQEYIHNDKHGNYTWCEQPEGYYMLPDKIDWIKENDLWDVMLKLYIEKKNRNNDPNVHSRTIFAVTVHEICQKFGFYEEEN
ncbi:MAG: hypothetical protein DBX48_01985 [Limosilactobacillus fermentum]|nr:MAG: hypothetical protein DBX48_01985 [Limosilactobacillus fermentum]